MLFCGQNKSFLLRKTKLYEKLTISRKLSILTTTSTDREIFQVRKIAHFQICRFVCDFRIFFADRTVHKRYIKAHIYY
jgi:hypothetical protein